MKKHGQHYLHGLYKSASKRIKRLNIAVFVITYILIYPFTIVVYDFFPEVINGVKKENQENPFRPPVDNLGAADYIIKCMKACWHEEPDLRPDIRYVRVRLKEMQVSNKFIYLIGYTIFIRNIEKYENKM